MKNKIPEIQRDFIENIQEDFIEKFKKDFDFSVQEIDIEKIDIGKIKKDFNFGSSRQDDFAAFLGTTTMTLNRLKNGKSSQNITRMLEVILTLFYAVPEYKRAKVLKALEIKNKPKPPPG